jgi:hypothetical protein
MKLVLNLEGARFLFYVQLLCYINKAKNSNPLISSIFEDLCNVLGDNINELARTVY